MTKPECQNCKFAHKSIRYEIYELQCRRFPPQLALFPGSTFYNFPEVCRDSWCGEFSEKEKE